MAGKDTIQDAVISHALRDEAAAPGASSLHPEAEYRGFGEAMKAFGKGFVRALGQAADRLIPQGRDELANAIFNGSAYWPGEQAPSLAAEPPMEHGVHGPSTSEPRHGLDDRAWGDAGRQGYEAELGRSARPAPDPEDGRTR